MLLSLKIAAMLSIGPLFLPAALIHTLDLVTLSSWRLSVKVGDLVRHQMYNELKAPAVVLEIVGTAIKILDEGYISWDYNNDYEVINEHRCG